MTRSHNVEQDYFVEIIRAFIAGEKKPPDAPESLQWKKLQQIAYRDPRCLQPLGPLIYQANAPWELKTEVGTGAKPMREQTLKTLDALPPILDALKQNGVPIVVLKGPALAHTVYHSKDRRFISDLDLLCLRENLDRACQVMEELGYQNTTTGRSEIFYEEHHFHRIYKNSDEVFVEIHWDLTVPSDFARFEPAELFANVCSVSTGKTEFLTLPPADLLLHMVSQALPEFYSVGRLLDVCLLIKAGALRNNHLITDARRRNLAIPLWIMLNLARWVMDDPDLNRVIKAIEPGCLRRNCIKSLPVRDRMFGSDQPASGVTRLLLVLCAPSWRYAGGRLSRFIVPSDEDHYILRQNPDQVSPSDKLRSFCLGLCSVGKMVTYLFWRLLCLPVRRSWLVGAR